MTNCKFYKKFLIEKKRPELTGGEPKPGRLNGYNSFACFIKVLFSLLKSLHFVVFCFLFCFSFKALSFQVILDPGHGGIELGTFYKGVKESEINWQVTKKLEKLLKKNNFKVKLSRKKDESIELKDRTERIRSFKGDLLISLHSNFSTDEKKRGAVFYVQNHFSSEKRGFFLAHQKKQNGNKEDLDFILKDLQSQYQILKSLKLAQSLVKFWKLPFLNSHKPIEQAYFFILSESNTPSVLVEMGFLSNKKERKQMQSEKYQNKMAKMIFQGLKHYKQNRTPSVFPSKRVFKKITKSLRKEK